MQRLKSLSPLVTRWSQKQCQKYYATTASAQPHSYPQHNHFQDQEVLVEGRAFSRTAILNRPSKLNAITTSMAGRLQRLYESWEDNSQIGFVTMKGSGRAFSSGADMLAIYRLLQEGKDAECKESFRKLYQFIYLLGTYLKPNLAILDGITMGGGAGIAFPGMFRIATDKTVFATPEVQMGFHPDAGASFYLSRLPGYLGINKDNIIQHLKKCSNLTQLECVYTYMIKNGYNQDCFMINQFVTACSTFYQTDYAVQAFSQMDDPNVFVYNAVIRAGVSSFKPIQAIWFYVKMLRGEISPTSYTFSSVIKGCALFGGESRIGEAINGHIWKFGFKSHVYVQTALIDFYSCLGMVFESRQVFDEMVERDVFAWTSMISVLARSGDLVSARKLFDMMPERNFASWNALIDAYARTKDVESAELLFSKMPEKDLISWTTLIHCYLQNKLYREALATFNDMMENGIFPDEVTMATVISACAHLGALDVGKKIHFYIKKHHFDHDVFIGSSLVDMYAKCGNLEQSLLVFYKLPEKNLFCWNSVIEGLAIHGYANEALKMFNDMVKANIKPNGVTFISVLSACTHVGMVKEGQQWFLSMTRDFLIPPEIEHYGCMVDLFSRAGLLDDAMQLIRDMRMEPNAVIWGALLGGCKLQKNLEIALLAVNKLMVLEPENSGYYTLLVNMFAEQDRWSEVGRVRSAMKDLRVKKESPGSSWIEMDGRIHQFSASDKYHPSCKEIYFLLDKLWIAEYVFVL